MFVYITTKSSTSSGFHTRAHTKVERMDIPDAMNVMDIRDAMNVRTKQGAVQ